MTPELHISPDLLLLIQPSIYNQIANIVNIAKNLYNFDIGDFMTVNSNLNIDLAQAAQDLSLSAVFNISDADFGFFFEIADALGGQITAVADALNAAGPSAGASLDLAALFNFETTNFESELAGALEEAIINVVNNGIADRRIPV